MQRAHPLHAAIRDVDMQIVDHRIPAGEDRAFGKLRLAHAQRGRLGDLQRADRAFAEPADPRQRLRIGVEQRAETAERGEQAARHRLGIAARDRQAQQIFDEFVILQRIRPLLDQSLAQTGTVAAGIVAGIGLRLRITTGGGKKLLHRAYVAGKDRVKQGKACRIAK